MTDFSRANPAFSSDWILTGHKTAEYWRVETKRRKRYLLEDGQVVFEPAAGLSKVRWVEERNVMHT